jgi:hypothetical protein
MERNRWETAIRCLEVALHPHTGDDEVIAGVNGFRRTADGTPLSEVCAALAGTERAAAAAEAAERLNRENADLRRKLETEQAGQSENMRRLRAAERLVLDLSAEIRAEQQSFAAFRSASAQIVEGLRDENFDLRGALEQTRRTAVAAPFRDLLTAAQSRDGPPGREPAPPVFTPPRHPWTA